MEKRLSINRELARSFWWIFLCVMSFPTQTGCAILANSHVVDGYESQKHIVWQGTMSVNPGEDLFRFVYFGYDRNGDLTSLTTSSMCRGVDLLEYKGVLPSGQWESVPVLVISDDNYDCFADRALFDCDGDGVFERVTQVPEGTIRLEVIDRQHRSLFETDCLNSRYGSFR